MEIECEDMRKGVLLSLCSSEVPWAGVSSARVQN